jgi:transposase
MGLVREARRHGADRGLLGNSCRHRLNCFGDRQLNRALHTIVMVRMRQDAETKQYVQWRVEQGKSVREIERCLKRYVARPLFRQLEATPRSLLDRT